MKNLLTIDLRKLTHSGIGRYLANVIPGVLPLLTADRIQLFGKPEEIATLGTLPATAVVIANSSAPHSLREQAFAFDNRLRASKGGKSVLWVPHYNIPMLFQGKLVCTVHDLAPLDLPETFGTAKRMLAWMLLRSVARHAAAILTPSEFSRDRIINRLHVPPERVCLTPLAVDAAWPSLAGASAPHVEADPYLLFVGNLKPNKNLVVLLQALIKLGPDAPLLLVAGKTEGFVTADEKARALAVSLGRRVRLLGHVPDAALIQLYRGSAALVMPSLYEGFGYPVLEAMRYGCPVIASNTTSLPEVAGPAAVYFNPRDPRDLPAAIRRVMQPVVSRQLVQAGFLREKQFTNAGLVKKTAEVLNLVLESR